MKGVKWSLLEEFRRDVEEENDGHPTRISPRIGPCPFVSGNQY
jgi:hypothetical protein